MDISLTESERALLVALLEKDLLDLRSEVYRAESHAAKELLKAREANVKQLLARLQPSAG